MQYIPLISKYRSYQYREYRFWSPTMGDYAARISMPGGYGAAQIHHNQNVASMEWYAIVQAPEHGREYREKRDGVLDAITDAIHRGDPPGEVETNHPAMR